MDYRNEIYLEVTITLNGEDLSMVLVASRTAWELGGPDFQLALLERCKTKLIRKATAGLEPRFRVHDRPPGPLGPMPPDSTATEVWLGA